MEHFATKDGIIFEDQISLIEDDNNYDEVFIETESGRTIAAYFKGMKIK